MNTTSPKNFFKVLQFNANGIHNKTDEIQLLIKNIQADVIIIQETKLNQSYKAPNILQLTPIRTDRTHKQEGLLTYSTLKTTSVFSQLDTSITYPIKVQIVKIHLLASQQLHIANMYIPPKHSNQLSQTENSIISSMLTTITNLPKKIITADVNTHSLLWYLPTKDHRGELIEDILLNSHHITLNTNTPTSTIQSIIHARGALNSQLFKKLRVDLDSDHLILLYHTQTQCLFKGNVTQ